MIFINPIIEDRGRSESASIANPRAKMLLIETWPDENSKLCSAQVAENNIRMCLHFEYIESQRYSYIGELVY